MSAHVRGKIVLIFFFFSFLFFSFPIKSLQEDWVTELISPDASYISLVIGSQHIFNTILVILMATFWVLNLRVQHILSQTTLVPRESRAHLVLQYK